MTRFRVWAPDASAVEVDLAGRRVEMGPTGDRGWWEVDVPEAGAGTDYRYSVDGRDPLPDPRSPWQPEGVHGPSRVVDHGAFPWGDAGWTGIHLPSAVLYELHVGTFSPEGTFEGVIPKLDHLVDLGVTAVELLPVAEFPGRRGWGYDGVDLWAPHSAYGGPHGLKRLVDACHARGLAVVLDVVYNHLGPDGNYLGAYGPYFTDRYRTPWGQAVNFDDAGADGVREFVVENALMWLRDYHVDGLRLDAVHAIYDESAFHVLEELAVAVERLAAQLGRRLFVTAESDRNDPRPVLPRQAGGYGLDAVWSDDVHHALHTVLTGERDGYYEDFGTAQDLGSALMRAYVYDGRWSPHRRRRHGRPVPRGTPGSRFVAFLQNHDQVGNRATGERIGHLAGVDRQMVGAALLLCSPFVPLLFAGEEWGASTPFQYFTDHGDAELGRAVSEGRRREFAAFGWDPEKVPDPQDPATFERSRLDWSEVTREPHARLLDWYRSLLRLRREVPDLAPGPLYEHRFYEFRDRGAVLERGDVSVVVNLGSEERAFVPVLKGAREVLLASTDDIDLVAEGVRLPPDSVAIVR